VHLSRTCVQIEKYHTKYVQLLIVFTYRLLLDFVLEVFLFGLLPFLFSFPKARFFAAGFLAAGLLLDAGFRDADRLLDADLLLVDLCFDGFLLLGLALLLDLAGRRLPGSRT